jgi:hypothetical protein
MRSASFSERPLVPEGREALRGWSSLIDIPLAMLLAAPLLPGGLLVLAWMFYCQVARRKRRISVSGATPAPTVCVLPSPAPQHGTPAGDARGATVERKH